MSGNPLCSNNAGVSAIDAARDERAGRRVSRAADPFIADDVIAPAVEISSADDVRRHAVGWDGMAAEAVHCASGDRIEFRFHAPMHLLVVYEGERSDGETLVEGLPRSTLRTLARRLTFVPAGHRYREWHRARSHMRRLHFYVDPAKLELQLEQDVAGLSLTPRLLFDDALLWHTASKLKSLLERSTPRDRDYLEALGVVLVHELVRLNRGAAGSPPVRINGGLAAWQQRIVAAYIEDHLAERIPLDTLAQLARLSRSHFCRAFKQSFGVPPHRYQTDRRVECAKLLLARPAVSVTDVGLSMGFCDTSSFSSAFRKATGFSPTGYQRTLW
jgi:AraC-like DNA-binding protein